MTCRILQGHVLDRLAELPDESVHCVITSPPYLGLRDYKLPPTTWGGDAACQHEWREHQISPRTGGGNNKNNLGAFIAEGSCGSCGAWRGSLGLEPTPALYIEHIVQVFREVRRVLRSDGVLWLNMGDSYASTPNGCSAADTKAAGNDDRTFRDKPLNTIGGEIKAKDLMEMPSAVVQALRADGWWLRSRLPWVKRNSMPESVNDRPSAAIEYVFLLSKSARYFYDAAAVRRPVRQSTVDRLAQNDGHPNWDGDRDRDSPQGRQTLDISKMMRGGPEAAVAMKNKQRGHGRRHAGFNDRWDEMEKAEQQAGGRSFRNADLFFASLEEPWGLISDAGGEPLALDVCPAGFADAHFATFPPRLLEPLILAGTSAKGVCPKCRAPWVRHIEKEKIGDSINRASDYQANGVLNRTMHAGPHLSARTQDRGWFPSCSCPDNVPIPATVLDPFGGAGTTGLVAESLGRDSILIELNPDYADMARARIRADLGRVNSDVQEKAAALPLFER